MDAYAPTGLTRHADPIVASEAAGLIVEAGAHSAPAHGRDLLIWGDALAVRRALFVLGFGFDKGRVPMIDGGYQAGAIDSAGRLWGTILVTPAGRASIRLDYLLSSGR